MSDNCCESFARLPMRRDENLDLMKEKFFFTFLIYNVYEEMVKKSSRKEKC